MSSQPDSSLPVGAPSISVLVQSGLFAIDETHRYRWTIDMTTDQVRELFRTFSDWTADEVEGASLAVATLGETISEAYTSWLITASPAPGLKL